MSRLIDPKLIRVDLDTQSRVEINDDVVNEYTELMSAGTIFPPVIVFDDAATEQFFLVDGFHRLAAHLKFKPNEAIAADVKHGDLADARWASIGANKTHGLRRTNEDKRNAIKQALRHPKGVNLSNIKIAEHVGVNDKTVASIRREMELSSEIPKIENRTVVRNNHTSYQQNTNMIGRNNSSSRNLSQEIPKMRNKNVTYNDQALHEDSNQIIPSQNLSSEFPTMRDTNVTRDNQRPQEDSNQTSQHPHLYCTECRFIDGGTCGIDGSKKVPWSSACNDFVNRVSDETQHNIQPNDYDKAKKKSVPRSFQNCKLKDCITVHLPSSNPQLFAVELREHWERDYLFECLAALNDLLEDEDHNF
jgi:hypothetical protein